MTLQHTRQRVRALCDAHEWQQAEPLLQQLLDAGQADAETWYLLAGLQGAKGEFVKAEASCREALVQDPEYTDAAFRLANALDAQGRKDEALAQYEAVLQARPEFAHGWNNAGVCLQSLRRFDEAADCFSRAVRLEPAVADFHINLALVSIQRGEMEIAHKAIDAAFVLDMPARQRVYAATLLGRNLLVSGFPQQAERMYRLALQADPEAVESHVNLGLALQAQNEVVDAGRTFDQVLQHDPANVVARLAAAHLRLLQADYVRAWPDYESRPMPAQCEPADGIEPDALSGRRLLLQQEACFGDTLFFLRFIPLLLQRGASVVLQCDESLAALCRRSFDSIQVIGPAQPVPECDHRLLLGSLAALFDATPELVDVQTGYLRADTSKHEQIQRMIADAPGALKVGFVWSGDSAQVFDRQRSMSVESFADLFEKTGVAFFSLQPHGAQPAVAQLLEAWQVHNLAPLLTDFDATAAALSRLDLVISVDTALAHLAGALGIDGVVCLPFAPNWCWGLEQEHSPWYPRLRLFRQQQPGDWDSVIEQAAKLLDTLR